MPASSKPLDLQLLLDAVIDYAIIMLDVEGRVVSWNAGAQRLKQYSSGEIIGRHFSDFYTQEDRAAGVSDQALRMARETGRYHAEGWRVRKDGSQFWAMVVIDAVRDHDGQLVGFAKITRDISDRLEAHLELAHSEGRYRRLVEAVVDYAIFQLDATGHVATWNPGAQRIKGYEQSEIIGRHFSTFYTDEDRAVGMPQAALRKAAEEGGRPLSRLAVDFHVAARLSVSTVFSTWSTKAFAWRRKTTARPATSSAPARTLTASHWPWPGSSPTRLP